MACKKDSMKERGVKVFFSGALQQTIQFLKAFLPGLNIGFPRFPSPLKISLIFLNPYEIFFEAFQSYSTTTKPNPL